VGLALALGAWYRVLALPYPMGPHRLGGGLLSATLGIAFAVWITRIIHQSVERRLLIEQLQATREELPRPSATPAGWPSAGGWPGSAASSACPAELADRPNSDLTRRHAIGEPAQVMLRAPEFERRKDPA